MAKYLVTAPQTPGATPKSEPATTLAEARKIARTFRARRDLTGQDVRLDGRLGSLIDRDWES